MSSCVSGRVNRLFSGNPLVTGGGPIRRAGVNGWLPSGWPVGWSPWWGKHRPMPPSGRQPQGGPARASQLVVTAGIGHLGRGLASRSWPG